LDFFYSFRAGALRRAAELRAADSARGDPRALTSIFWRGKLLVEEDNRPVLTALDHPALADCREPPVFVGLADGLPRFAADLALWHPHEDAATIGQFTDVSHQVHPAFPGARLVEVRGLMNDLALLDAECVATGRALLGWHATHRFCPNCGAPSIVEAAGWQRKCPACATQHFPRTDPVVIMAITRGDRLLLGRGTSWPERMYSLLAGFVEPGETIEAAVRRETLEESGIHVGDVQYVASQPWPFPMSLVFGCHGEALDDSIVADPLELADALWVSRIEAQDIVAGRHRQIGPPRHGAIAAALIAAWAEDRLLDPAAWGDPSARAQEGLRRET
jgi:NAD+ diphosphatase